MKLKSGDLGFVFDPYLGLRPFIVLEHGEGAIYVARLFLGFASIKKLDLKHHTEIYSFECGESVRVGILAKSMTLIGKPFLYFSKFICAVYNGTPIEQMTDLDAENVRAEDLYKIVKSHPKCKLVLEKK